MPEARLNKFPGFYERYRTPECIECTARYAKIAADVSTLARLPLPPPTRPENEVLLHIFVYVLPALEARPEYFHDERCCASTRHHRHLAAVCLSVLAVCVKTNGLIQGSQKNPRWYVSELSPPSAPRYPSGFNLVLYLTCPSRPPPHFRILVPAAGEQIGLTPSQMALAFVYTREFITSTIVGATNIDTLRENLRALNCPVTEAAHEKIVEVHEE